MIRLATTKWTSRFTLKALTQSKRMPRIVLPREIPLCETIAHPYLPVWEYTVHPYHHAEAQELEDTKELRATKIRRECVGRPEGPPEN